MQWERINLSTTYIATILKVPTELAVLVIHIGGRKQRIMPLNKVDRVKQKFLDKRGSERIMSSFNALALGALLLFSLLDLQNFLHDLLLFDQEGSDDPLSDGTSG